VANRFSNTRRLQRIEGKPTVKSSSPLGAGDRLWFTAGNAENSQFLFLPRRTSGAQQHHQSSSATDFRTEQYLAQPVDKSALIDENGLTV